MTCKSRILVLQAAESVAESVLNLASSDSVVMVRVDPAYDTSGSNTSISGPIDGAVIVHSPDNSNSNITHIEGAVDPLAPPSSLEQSREGIFEEKGAEGGEAEGGEMEPPLTVVVGRAPQPQGKTPTGPPGAPGPAQGDRAPTNPMSVSVPNLTSSMEQTVSLLESFAAMARRNLGNNGNPMVRANNATSLVRLALSSTANG